MSGLRDFRGKIFPLFKIKARQNFSKKFCRATRKQSGGGFPWKTPAADVLFCCFCERIPCLSPSAFRRPPRFFTLRQSLRVSAGEFFSENESFGMFSFFAFPAETRFAFLRRIFRKILPARALPQFLRNALSRRRTAAHTCADRLLFFFPILKFVLAAAFTRNCFAFCLRTESFSHNLAADCALRTFLRKTYPRFPSEHFSIRLFFPFSETNSRAEISPYVLSTREISGD